MCCMYCRNQIPSSLGSFHKPRCVAIQYTSTCTDYSYSTQSIVYIVYIKYVYICIYSVYTIYIYIYIVYILGPSSELLLNTGLYCLLIFWLIVGMFPNGGLSIVKYPLTFYQICKQCGMLLHTSSSIFGAFLFFPFRLCVQVAIKVKRVQL